ncbi:MAG: uncharacterized membrane protein YjfL (UPF0719 family) [Bacteroidia bacterium]|jgi:uncharacterized membrane protein YjfL (UPF0719 family)
MIHRNRQLVFGQRTAIYFLSLVVVTLYCVFLVPVGAYILSGNLAAYLIIGAIVWLSFLFVFSFKSNPTALSKVVKWAVSFILILLIGHSVLQSIGRKIGQELAKHGVVTQATLIDKEVKSGRSSPPQFNLTVQYANENAANSIETFKVSLKEFEAMEINQVFSVRYSRRYPALMRVEVK